MIDPTASVATSTDNSLSYAERVPMQKLGQDEFIKILVTQLRSQDPLNPQKDTEFVGQMAQFSSLESTKMMQEEIQSLRANSLLGQSVEIAGEENNIIGQVTSVDKIKGELKIIVDGLPYSLSDVIRVERAVTEAPRQPQPLTRNPTSTQ
jgi:flagellar basal-body rod modification protein FlgD